MNRVHIKTYGCQMNERDSEAVAAMLRALVTALFPARTIAISSC